MNLVLSRTVFVFVVFVKCNCMNFLFLRLFPQAHCSLQVHSTLLVPKDGRVEYAIGSGIISHFFIQLYSCYFTVVVVVVVIVVVVVVVVIIVVIIIIIIIISIFTFMQGIYNYIPATNHVSRVYSIVALLYL